MQIQAGRLILLIEKGCGDEDQETNSVGDIDLNASRNIPGGSNGQLIGLVSIRPKASPEINIYGLGRTGTKIPVFAE
jgi:hypothetical protein